jgi:hypothetical protein
VKGALQPRRTHYSDGVLGLPGGNEDNDLWYQHQEHESGDHIFLSVWEPDEEQRRAIAEGANVQLLIWGSGHPPVSVGINFDPLGKPPKDEAGE